MEFSLFHEFDVHDVGMWSRPIRTPYNPTTDQHKKKIVFFGDSFTYGANLDYPDTLTALLQERLGDEYLVLNLGQSMGSYDLNIKRLIQYFNNQQLSENTVCVVYGGTATTRRNVVVSRHKLSDWSKVNDDNTCYGVHPGDLVIHNYQAGRTVKDQSGRLGDKIDGLNLLSDPIEDLMNFEKNLKMLEYLTLAKQVNCYIWRLQHWDIGSQPDLDFINAKIAREDTKRSTDFRAYDHWAYLNHEIEKRGMKKRDILLPCNHFNRLGNEMIIQGMWDDYFNKYIDN